MAGPFDGQFKNRARLLERLDSMIESGRVIPEEAAQLRSAKSDEEFEAAVAAIRSRHAEASLARAVEAGEMSQSDAEANLERIRHGEHPRGLRAHLSRLGRHR